ncbi:MAG: hypothetical protein ACI8UO_003381 [Verrucomicrobiales bacterium]|jgi:hypothetical protein
MFRTIKNLIGMPVEAIDGACGKCCDLLFDDRNFAIRYIVVDVGGFFSRDEVLVSPLSFKNPDLGKHDVSMGVALTKEQIESSPPLAEHEPVSLEYEHALAKHYGHPPYWVGPDLWGMTPYPMAITPPPSEQQPAELSAELEQIRKHHLRSANKVMGYQVKALNGDVGTVADCVVETKPWQIRYFVVDTGKWLPGRKVLLSPSWEQFIRWEDKSVSYDLTRDRIENSPKFDPHTLVNVDYDGVLHDYYGVPLRGKQFEPVVATK